MPSSRPNLFVAVDNAIDAAISGGVKHPLRSGGGGDTSPSMDLQAERDLTDAKIAAAEARTDTKFARMDGKLDLLLSEMKGVRADTKNARNVIVSTVVPTVVTVGLALAGLMYALFSYGAAQFYNGTVVRDMVHSEVIERLPSQQTQQK